MIAVLCGIKIFAVRCLILSQYTHLTERHTDRRTDRQNCDSNTVRRITCSRTVKKRKNRSLSHPLGHVGVTYALHLWLIRKPVVDFIFVVNGRFRYLLRLRHYERKSVEVGVYRRGWVAFSAGLRDKGASPTNHCWCQKTRVISFSCGVYPQSFISFCHNTRV